MKTKLDIKNYLSDKTNIIREEILGRKKIHSEAVGRLKVYHMVIDEISKDLPVLTLNTSRISKEKCFIKIRKFIGEE